MEYTGEHLLPGKIGHFFLLLSLVASLGATVFYFLSVQRSGNRVLSTGSEMQWKKLARFFFFVEVFSVFAVFAILFYLIKNHYFEYKYVWQHSSRSLETKYLLSCFWEGQEGSFLLWSIWHCIIGLIFIWREKKWEAPVMAIVSFAQVILATMLIGDVMGLHMGANPFLLMRNSDVMNNAPVFFDMNTGALRADYVELLYRADGNGLNILLQNYWMVIHPPVLFLGFASTLIPFAFAVAGLWTRNYAEWTKAALPWALFAGGIFGLGIMMGAAWAYESLNFGGYWAWDPVENASLVPWLVLVAGIHTLVIFRHTGNALRTTHLFFILTFVFVLYSTYLTRSGELQDTSVHAFTGDGITLWHLRIMLLSLSVPAFFLFFKRYKSIPFIAKEEETSSREFWMFVGSLVLFLSALTIIAMTSIPVINKIAGLFTGGDKELFKPLRMGEDSEHSYNQIQIFVAILIGLFSGIGMYLKYKATPGASLKKLWVPTIAGLAIAGLILAFGNIDYQKQGIGFQVTIWIAVLAAVYALVTNGVYIFSGAKANSKKAGGAISHVGFALVLLGILVSSSKKEVISLNRNGIPAFFGEGSKENPGENLTLVKGLRTDMGKYWVTYEKDSLDPQVANKYYYRVKFDRKDGSESFTLTPNAFVNNKGQRGLSANPDARHYFTHDVFTYITSLPDPAKKGDTASFQPYTVSIGDSVFYSGGYLVLDRVETTPNPVQLTGMITVHSNDSTTHQLRPRMQVAGNQALFTTDTLVSENLVVGISVKPEENKFELQVKESNALLDYITLKAYRFPGINILWAGTIIMVIGFFLSGYHRRVKKRMTRVEEKNTAGVLEEIA